MGENQISVFISPSDGVAQVYPQAAGSLFVAFYDSQGYGGDIANPLAHIETTARCRAEDSVCCR
jgi:hypothetical protein